MVELDKMPYGVPSIGYVCCSSLEQAIAMYKRDKGRDPRAYHTRKHSKGFTTYYLYDYVPTEITQKDDEKHDIHHYYALDA